MKLLLASMSFVAGVVLGHYAALPYWVLVFTLLLLPLALHPGIRNRVILVVLCSALLAGGVAHAQRSLPPTGPHTIAHYNDSARVEIHGLVSGEVEYRDRTQHLTLTATQIIVDGSARQAEGQLLVIVPRYPQYYYGDEICARGDIDAPPVFIDEQSGAVAFDYAAYLALQDIHSVMVYPHLELYSRNNGNPLLSGLYDLRSKLASSLAVALPEPQAALAQAMLLGMRHNIPEVVKGAFSHTGTYHLLAISGLHLGIVAALAVGLGTAVLGRRYYLYVWLALAVIWGYGLISGANPPVIRAAIMATVFLAAELAGRQRNILPALGLAASVMVAFDVQVIFSVSFQMSFAAMAGIVLAYPWLRQQGLHLAERLFKNATKLMVVARPVIEGLAVSLGASIFIFPLVAYYFGLFSPVGPLATLLVIPVMAAVIILCAATALAGLFWNGLALVLGLFCWALLSYILLVINLVAALPFAYYDQILFPAWTIPCYYLLLAVAGFMVSNWKLVFGWLTSLRRLWRRQPQSGRATGKGIASLLLVVVLVAGAVSPAGCGDETTFEISFLNVGQGDSILLMQGDTQVLIDGGPSPQVLMNELGEVMPFWDRTIEMVILTHAHTDHIYGLIEVIKRYRVECVLYPDTAYLAEGYDAAALQEFMQLISAKGINCLPACRGQSFNIGMAAVSVLNPPLQLLRGTSSDIDNNSIVLEVRVGQLTFLLTGDIMQPAEMEMVLNRLLEPVTVLKVAHHGSGTSSSREFLSVVRPKMAVITVGENEHGHPNPQVLARLAEFTAEQNILRTDLCGRIALLTDGRTLWLKQVDRRSG